MLLPCQHIGKPTLGFACHLLLKRRLRDTDITPYEIYNTERVRHYCAGLFALDRNINRGKWKEWVLYLNAAWGAAVYLGGGVPLRHPVCAIEGECVSLLDVLIIAPSYVQIMNMQKTVCEQKCKYL